MSRLLKGKAHAYGDNIDTDRIIPGKYTKTLDLSELAAHCLEDLDPEFRCRVKPGDWVIAGDNFGCGSSREQAPLSLKAAGVSGIIARGFARIFFRNAINIGLPALEVPDLAAEHGDDIEVDLTTGTVRSLTRGTSHRAATMPDVMLQILNEGGLVAYLKKNGNYR